MVMVSSWAFACEDRSIREAIQKCQLRKYRANSTSLSGQHAPPPAPDNLLLELQQALCGAEWLKQPSAQTQHSQSQITTVS